MDSGWLIDALALDALADLALVREEEEQEEYCPEMTLLEAMNNELRTTGEVLDAAGNTEALNGKGGVSSFEASSGTDDELDQTGSVTESGSTAALAEVSSQAPSGPADGNSLRRRGAWLLPRRGRQAASATWDDDGWNGSRSNSFSASSPPGASNGNFSPRVAYDLQDKGKLEKHVIHQGPVLITRNAWRKSRSFTKRIAEIRLDIKSGEHQLWTYKVTKDGRRSLSSDLCLSLTGAAVEAYEPPENPELHGFRIFSLPEVGQDPLDLLVESAADRAPWLDALVRAVERQPAKDEEVPLAGTLKLTVVHARLSSRFRRTADAGNFVVIRYNGTECRSVTRGQDTVSAETGETDVAFGHAKELPVFDDDPDSLITFELWAARGRGSIGSRNQMLGCIEVPLFLFGRNHLQELSLPLRDANLVGLGCEESFAAGTILIMGGLWQSFQSLFLPRPMRTNKVKYHLVDMPVKAQLKEFESFSSRFMHHSDTWQRLSIRLKRVHQWNQPAVSFAILMGLTLLIGFLHEYIMPIGVLALLIAALVRHPYCQKYLRIIEAWMPNSRFLALICSRNIIPAGSFDVLKLETIVRRPLKKKHEGKSNGPDHNKPQATEASSKEIFENQRRHVFSSFKPQRLRPWLDPPAWSDADGKVAEAPQPMQGGVPYTWRVDVNQFTDGEGWRYAKGFGQTAVWSNSFTGGGNVRRRRYIGWPVASARGSTPSLGGSTTASTASNSNMSEINLSRHESTDHSSHASADLVHATSLSDAAEMAADAPSPWRLSSASKHRDSNSRGLQDAGAPKTPYQEMYRNLVTRAAYMRHHMEYWMDWYERRKNLLLGATAHTSSIALVLLSGLLVSALLLPTRWLVLAFIYTFFWDGFVTGLLMRKNRNSLISQLKDVAVERWLEGKEACAKAQLWGEGTLLDEVTNTGVQTLKLCDWIKREFFDGRPQLTLRAVQRCRTLGDLASIVTSASDKFSKRRQRKRVWYRSTMRNLLDHVPSDVTIFRSASATYQPPIKA